MGLFHTPQDMLMRVQRSGYRSRHKSNHVRIELSVIDYPSMLSREGSDPELYTAGTV